MANPNVPEEINQASSCLPWKLFLRENWVINERIPHEQRRIRLMRDWANAPQEFRNTFVQRATVLQSDQIATLTLSGYYGDLPQERSHILNALHLYPCIRTDFSEENSTNWEKIKLFLKLDENLSPLHEEELPPIVEDEVFEGLELHNYAANFIFGKANFSLMGMTDDGKPQCYYHILMIADKHTFSDGTLLHVDFDPDGKPDGKHRFLAIDSYTPWSKYSNHRLGLGTIERELEHEQSSFDLSRPVVNILRDEMESREIFVDEARDLTQLAIEAVRTVNPALLNQE